MRHRTRLALAAALILPPAMVLGPPAAGAGAPAISVQNGETQPVFSRAEAILETVYVETSVDSDFDGVLDRVAMDVMRPKETEAGLKVATVMEASPYYAGGNDVVNHDVDIDADDPAARALFAANRLDALVEAGAITETGPFDSYYDNFFVPRGYAVALVDSIGTRRSTGCPTSGGRNETLGIKAAIDWLNGRARGFHADGSPARASWSTGAVGMLGVSYNGTLPNAVATTGVEGLKTIVPIAGISSWYDYYRANGGVVAPGGFQGEDTDVLTKFIYTRDDREICRPVIDAIEREQDRITGDYSPFWAERDYLPDVGGVRASVLLVHGLNDWNVKTKHFGQWWDALAARGVPRQLWLHQAAHTSPFQLRHAEWMRKLHHWMDFWLYGVDNGVMDEPRVEVEHAPGQWSGHADWPEPGTRSVPLRLNAGSAGGAGTLGLVPRPGPAEDFVDQRTRTAEELAADETGGDPNRLLYVSPPLDRPVRMSGVARMSVRASLDGRSPYLTALLVDYGTAVRATGGTRSTGERVCYGQGVEGDDGCTTLRTHVTAQTPFKIVTRGWLDVRNRHDPARTEPVAPGRTYTFRWDMQPEDHVFAAGHRIGVVVLSTDYDYTLRYPPGTRVTLRPGTSTLWLPVAPGGGRLAF